MAPTLLLITKDAPIPDTRKAGLFPVAIRHHLALEANVLLYSIEDGYGAQAATLTGFPGLTYINAEMRAPGWQLTKWRAAFALHRSRQLVRFARDYGVVAICGLQSAPQSGLLAQRTATAIGCPFASWEHLSSYGRPEARLHDVALKHFFEQTGAVAAVSNRTLKAIERRYNLSLANGVTIPNPVPDDFEAGETPNPNRYARLTSGNFTFGAWTNWRDLKRLDVLLEAFDQVAQLRPEARLIVAGPISHHMQEAVDRHSATDRIFRLGNISREEIRHLAYAVDCCCLPSDYETFGLPVVESLAAGRPVISTDTDGPCEILGGRAILGQLVPKGDVSAFAKAMMAVMDRPLGHPAERLRAHAIAEYGFDAQVSRWRSFYKGLGVEV